MIGPVFLAVPAPLLDEAAEVGQLRCAVLTRRRFAGRPSGKPLCKLDRLRLDVAVRSQIVPGLVELLRRQFREQRVQRWCEQLMIALRASPTIGGSSRSRPAPYQPPTAEPSGKRMNNAKRSRKGPPSKIGAWSENWPCSEKQPTLPQGRPSSQPAKSSSKGGASMPGGNAARMLSRSIGYGSDKAENCLVGPAPLGLGRHAFGSNQFASLDHERARGAMVSNRTIVNCG